MREKRITRNCWLLLLMAVTFLASSCSSDDTTVTSNDYCYIKSVTLGSVNRKIERRDRQGKLISIVNTSVTGSNFAMTINQRDSTIENRDYLPYGCDVSAITANIVFDGSMLKYRTKGSNGGWTAYNSTDTLDLTSPLELELTSNDSQSSRTYTFTINVYTEEGDSLYWKQCEKDVAQLTDLTDMKAFVLNDNLMVLGKKGSDLVLAERTGIEAQGTWKKVNDDEHLITLPSTTDLQTLRQQGDKLYLSTSDGSIFSSTNALAWTQEGTTYTAPLTLIEKTANYFYAVSGGKLLRSADAITWDDDKPSPNPDEAFLPSSDIRALTLQQSNGSTRIVMVGQKNGEGEEYTKALVWNKMWNDGWETFEADAEWMYFPLSPDNKIPCPRLGYFNLLAYDGKCLAFGGASADGTHKALDAMYFSQDYGITWRPSTELHLPIQLEGTDGCITSVVDKNNFIWLITNAQVWRGRLNRLGFAQQ